MEPVTVVVTIAVVSCLLTALIVTAALIPIDMIRSSLVEDRVQRGRHRRPWKGKKLWF